MSVIETSTPPLKAGDHVTLSDFLQRWQAMPELKRAELIEGIVYMPSPVGVTHGDMENLLATWLGNYALATPGCTASNNATLIISGNSPQPDVHLRLLPEVGGRTDRQDDLLHGPPELVVEVCVSSASYDLHQKRKLYQSAGVPEYLALLMYEQEIRWQRLSAGQYHILPPGADGLFRSQMFPGLWLNGAALLAGNSAQIMATLQQGLQSPEHAAFVAELQRRRTGGSEKPAQS